MSRSLSRVAGVLGALLCAAAAHATKPLPDVEVELVAGGTPTPVAGAEASWAAVHAAREVLAATTPVKAKPGHRWDEVLAGRCVVVRFGPDAGYRRGDHRVLELRMPLPAGGFFGESHPFPDSAFARLEEVEADGSRAEWITWLGGVPAATRERLAEAMSTPER